MKDFIKELLLSNQFRVYTIVVDHYYDMVLELGPSLFRSWLADEFAIEEYRINRNSLNSAISRYRNKLKRREILSGNEKAKPKAAYTTSCSYPVKSKLILKSKA